MNDRIEPRTTGSENASVEFTPGNNQMSYHFKLRDFSSKGLSIMVKEDSQVLKLLKKGDIFEMQYYPVKSDSHPISHKTEIKHISKPDPGTCKGHILVGLLILE